MAAADVVELVKRLGAPYGLERSVKITPEALLDDRYLISIHRSALGISPAERLVAMGRELGMPPSFENALSSSFESADIVHFGYEGGPGDELCKIYLEYASRAREAIAAANRAPVLVHMAYKWSRQRPDSRAVTRYTWAPCRTRQEVESKLHALMPAGEAPRALRCALGLLSRVAPFADSGRLFLMEVEECGNPRRSCDLNVYDAELRVSQIADLLEAAAIDFAVPPPRARAVLDRSRDLALGHLSAGVGRSGEEFVTIYYGIEAH
jgi:tryptophan 7-halogenase